jgi:hypothetical protein
MPGMRLSVSSRLALAVLGGFFAFTGAPAFAWSGLGHQLVGELAQRRLSPAAAAQVRELLRGEEVPTLAGIAMWADAMRIADPERFKATSRWHYVNLHGKSCRYSAGRDCKDGQCVIGALDAQLRLLRDTSQPLAIRRDALKFVVHLVGDIHQPLHVSNVPDRGGNDFAILLHTDIPPEEYAREKFHDGVMDTNLHAVWDYYVPASAGLNLATYADRLAASGPASVRQRGFVAWARESCELIAPKKLYPQSHELTAEYLQAMRPVAERRIEEAGIRLARLLNEALAVH